MAMVTSSPLQWVCNYSIIWRCWYACKFMLFSICSKTGSSTTNAMQGLYKKHISHTPVDVVGHTWVCSAAALQHRHLCCWVPWDFIYALHWTKLHKYLGMPPRFTTEPLLWAILSYYCGVCAYVAQLLLQHTETRIFEFSCKHGVRWFQKTWCKHWKGFTPVSLAIYLAALQTASKALRLKW